MATTHDPVEFVTVGAGWTAGILAQKLTAAGHEVLSLEAGDERWTSPDFEHNHDTLKYAQRQSMMYDISTETWTWRPNAAARALPMRLYGSFHPGQGLGGAGAHWAAETWRFYPSDFEYLSHHLDRYGAARIPEGATLHDWGITYDELEPHFDAWEYDVGLSGRAGNLRGEIQDGGNPFEGSRERPYPLPPLESSIPASMFAEAARDQGYHPFPQPSAILSEAYEDLSGRMRSGCLYCGFCVRYGCEVDAKASAIVSHIPMALETGRYEVRGGCKVVEVLTDSSGKATGLRYYDRAGREHVQPAGTVVLSAYTLSNVRLLLLSAGGAHPDGVGNDRGNVGRNYTYQVLGSPATGVFEGRRFNLYMGNAGIATAMHDLNADNFDHSDLDFIGGASITCGGGEREPIGSVGDMPVGDGARWGAEWKEELRSNWDSSVSIGVQGESLAYEDHFLDLDPAYTDAHGFPLLRITYDFKPNDRAMYRYLAGRIEALMTAMGPTRTSFDDDLGDYNVADYQSTHNTGGAIMGASPDHAVTNKYGQVWDTPNVFVTGAALYPQNPGMNPTGTLCALTYHTADAILDRYREHELLD